MTENKERLLALGAEPSDQTASLEYCISGNWWSLQAMSKCDGLMPKGQRSRRRALTTHWKKSVLKVWDRLFSSDTKTVLMVFNGSVREPTAGGMHAFELTDS